MSADSFGDFDFDIDDTGGGELSITEIIASAGDFFISLTHNSQTVGAGGDVDHTNAGTRFQDLNGNSLQNFAGLTIIEDPEFQ